MLPQIEVKQEMLGRSLVLFGPKSVEKHFRKQKFFESTIPLAHKCIHVFRLSHVVLVIISITTFCLVPSKNSWNSASEDPNITYKDQIKGLESSLLWLKENNLFHKSKGVEVFKQYHFFPQENGYFGQNNYFLWKNTWW